MNQVWALLSTLILIAGCFSGAPPSARLYQVSTIQALMQGVYDGHTSIGQLKTKGDLGLGTLNGLDGELIVTQGEFFQVRADGRAYQVDDQELTPFAAVVWFRPEISQEISRVENYRQLTEKLNALLPSPNLFYAIQIQGQFGYLKTRSVSKQHQPYPRLTEVVKDQKFFEFRQTRGTLVGFYAPEFTQNLQVPGYHLHFLTADRTGGGHLLECQIDAALVQIDLITTWEVELPQDETFKSTTLRPTSEAELHQVEK